MSGPRILVFSRRRIGLPLQLGDRGLEDDGGIKGAETSVGPTVERVKHSHRQSIVEAVTLADNPAGANDRYYLAEERSV